MKIKDGFKDIPKSKNDPEYGYYVKSCLTKRAYDDKESAVKAAFKLGTDKKEKTQIYFCSFCGKYHVTSHCYETRTGSYHNLQVTGKNGKIIRRAANIIKKKDKPKVIPDSEFKDSMVEWNDIENGYCREFEGESI